MYNLGGVIILPSGGGGRLDGKDAISFLIFFNGILVLYMLIMFLIGLTQKGETISDRFWAAVNFATFDHYGFFIISAIAALVDVMSFIIYVIVLIIANL